MSPWRWLGLIPLAGIVALLLLGPGLSAARSPAAAPSSCVTCHTDRATLAPLVRPLPPPPAEGEG
jgi:mono/diheme cytochrome c family protein